MIGQAPANVSPPSGFASLGNASADQIIVENHAGTSASWVTVAGDLTQTGGVFKVVAISGPSPIAVTPALFQWAVGTVSPGWQHLAQTSDAACTNIQLKPQAPFASATGTNRNPGGVTIDLAAPTNGGTTEGFVRITRAGTQLALLQADPSVTSIFGFYTGSAAPTSSNHTLLGNGNSTFVNAPTSDLHLQASGTDKIIVDANGVQMVGTALSFGGGNGVIGVTNAVTDPSTKPSGGGIAWERHDGSALAHFGSGGAQCDMAPSGTGTVNTQALVERSFKLVGATPLSQAVTAIGSINLNAYRGKQVDMRLLYQLRDTTDPTAGGGAGGGMNSGEYRLLISNTGGVVAIQASLLLWQLSPTVSSSGPTFDTSVTDVITFKGASPNANAWDWTLTINMPVN